MALFYHLKIGKACGKFFRTRFQRVKDVKKKSSYQFYNIKFNAQDVYVEVADWRDKRAEKELLNADWQHPFY